MTLTIPSSRFAAMLASAEDAIAADAFVVLRFEDPVRAPINNAPSGAGREAMESVTPLDSDDRRNGITLSPARVAAASRPSPPSPVRAPLALEPSAPWWRSERAYRRSGVERFALPSSRTERWLLAGIWLGALYVALRVGAWALDQS